MTFRFHDDLQLPAGQPEEFPTVQIRQDFSEVRVLQKHTYVSLIFIAQVEL